MTEERLLKIHEKFQTPWKLILASLKKEAKIDAEKGVRIVAGEANEVYKVFATQGIFILRIASLKEADFTREQWAKDRCQEKGVPIAPTVCISELEDSGKRKKYMLEKYIAGQPVAPALWNEGVEKWKNTIREAGRYLSRIHSISTHGFGYINGKGEGEISTFEDWIKKEKINDSVERDFLRISHEHGLSREDEQAVVGVVKVIQNNLLSYPPKKACLLHADFGPKHWIVDEELKIRAVLDFGECEGGDPVKDFSRLNFWNRDSLPLNILKEGYVDKALFEGDFEMKFELYRLMQGMDLVWYYGRESTDKKMFMGVIEKIKKDLKSFERVKAGA